MRRGVWPTRRMPTAVGNAAFGPGDDHGCNKDAANAVRQPMCADVQNTSRRASNILFPESQMTGTDAVPAAWKTSVC
jgi:hypothetical protein